MAHTPLAVASCDAAVFSLALMGTDYGAFLHEAGRVLKEGGQLWIAEVSRVVHSVVLLLGWYSEKLIGGGVRA
jgi:ribosomal RNA-processing protein 8